MRKMTMAMTPTRQLSLALTAATLLATSPAHAGDEEEIALVAAAATVVAADVSFVVRNAVLAADGGDAQFEYALTQTLLATPQAVALNGAMVALMHDHDAPEAFLALHVPAMMTTALAVHGMWTLASPDEDQRFMFLASTAIGVNTMWTSFALGTATSGRNRFEDVPAVPGVYEILTTAPGIAVGVHQALETDRFREGWIAISAWSGLLTLHGLLFSFELLGNDDDYDLATNPTSRPALPNISFAPTSFGAPVEGAPQTPGLIVSGTL